MAETLNDYTFTARSGNRAIIRTLIMGDRSIADATWDYTPSPEDRDEAAANHAERITELTGRPVQTINIHVEDREKRHAIFRKRLGGARG